jgi:DNA-binding GntR family transcriptional regulator
VPALPQAQHTLFEHLSPGNPSIDNHLYGCIINLYFRIPVFNKLAPQAQSPIVHLPMGRNRVHEAGVRVSKTSFTDAAYRYLLDQILSHELHPGTALRSVEISPRLGLSRTPVERAIERLAGEGYVEFRPGRGPFVASVKPEEVLGLYDIRTMLEAEAVRLGLAQANDEFIRQLEFLLARREQAIADRESSPEEDRGVAESDRDLHLHIMSLWPNAKVQALYRQMNVHLRRFQLFAIARTPEDRAKEEHRRILEAIKSRDIQAAIQAIRDHGDASRERFRQLAAAAGLVERPGADPANQGC